MKSHRNILPWILKLIFPALVFPFISFESSAPEPAASGEILYIVKNKPLNLTVSQGQFISGPDQMEPSKTIRRLMFTSSDLTPKVNSCKTMKCIDEEFVGLQVDITEGPRLLYWLVLNNQLVQYSGTAQPESLTLTENSPKRIAGTLAIDDSKAGGPKINIKFDLKLSKAFDK